MFQQNSIENKLNNKIYSGLTLSLAFLVSSLILMYGGWVSVAIFLIYFLLSHGIGALVEKDKDRVFFFFHFCFVFLSFWGTIITIDNISNFGTQFGFASDDTRFFNRIIDSINGITIEKKGIFEAVMAVPGFIYQLIIPGEIQLWYFLPMIWLFSSVVCWLMYKLTATVTAFDVPPVIFLIPLFNFIFVDSMVRLYRDSLLYIFFIGALLLFIRKRYFLALGASLFCGLLRGANGVLLLSFFTVILINRHLPRKHIRFILLIAFLSCASLLLKTFGGRLLPYMTDASRADTYVNAFSGFNFSEMIKMRNEHNMQFTAENSLTNTIYTKGGGALLVLKPLIMLLFPITLQAPIIEKTSGSVEAKITTTKGFFSFYFLSNLFIAAWIIVLPLLVLGLIRGMKSDCAATTALVSLFFLSLLMVSFISGQIRHGLTFIVLFPTICALGLETLKTNRMNVKAFKMLVIGVFLLLCMWNIGRSI
ncbi:MAG: hypothetical protein JW795_19360 [Chitinivibrionales bacterium]|nr:hypothetical protein [Chitinivibrionales bacterium]